MKIQKNKSLPKNIKIAHRGLWDKNTPENSIGAYKKALKENIPIELDVHILKDNTLVVFHDNNLKRMTGEDKLLKNTSYDEIKNLKLNNTKYHIPTLKEVLDLIDGKVLLDIEIKTDIKSFRICKELCKTLDLYTGDFLIKSFSPIIITWFRFFKPYYSRGLLVSSLKHKKMSKITKFICYHMLLNFLCKPDFIAFDIRDLPNRKIEKLRKKGIPIYLWTIQNNKEITFESDGIIFEK